MALLVFATSMSAQSAVADLPERQGRTRSESTTTKTDTHVLVGGRCWSIPSTELTGVLRWLKEPSVSAPGYGTSGSWAAFRISEAWQPFRRPSPREILTLRRMRRVAPVNPILLSLPQPDKCGSVYVWKCVRGTHPRRVSMNSTASSCSSNTNSPRATRQ